MFKKFKTQIATLTSLAIILVPSLIMASPFSSDSSLEVFPYNQTLTFETTTNTKATQAFSIKNTSDREKTIYVQQYPKNGFQYLGSSYIVIPANSSSYISVNFKSAETGNFDSIMRIQHNDTKETKNINLSATVYSNTNNNGVSVSETSINFGEKTSGSNSTTDIQIRNNNSFPINISTSQLKQPFRVISHPTKLDAYQTGIITVEFSPENKGSFSQNFTVNTSDPSRNTINMIVKGSSNSDNNTSESKEGSLNLSSNRVIFNQTSSNSSTSKKVTISNPNSFDVEVKLPSNIQKPFTAKLQNATGRTTVIKARSSKTLTVTFQPTQNQYYEQDIILSTDLKNNKTYEIQVQANSRYRNDNPNQPNPPIPYNPNPQSPYTSLEVTRNNLNPDLNQIAYFNFNFGQEFQTQNSATLSIKDTKNNQTIYSQSANNLPNGRNNWKLSWNGKNYNSNSVLEGNYEYTVTLSSRSGYQKNYQGSINVVRNPSHMPVNITSNVIQDKKCLSYTDVKYDSNLCDAIIFADDQNLLKNNQTIFTKDKEVTRAQALSSLVKLFDLKMQKYNPNIDGSLGFTDIESNNWILPFIKTIQFYDKDNMILSGYENKDLEKEFRPEQIITRGELYKLFFEIANLETQAKNNYLMDYYLTQRPFQDTAVDSNYDWYTPYAGLALEQLNNSNFTKKYFGSFSINPYTKFCAHQEVDKEEFFELIYEAHKTRTIRFN